MNIMHIHGLFSGQNSGTGNGKNEDRKTETITTITHINTIPIFPIWLFASWDVLYFPRCPAVC